MTEAMKLPDLPKLPTGYRWGVSPDRLNCTVYRGDIPLIRMLVVPTRPMVNGQYFFLMSLMRTSMPTATKWVRETNLHDGVYRMLTTQRLLGE